MGSISVSVPFVLNDTLTFSINYNYTNVSKSLIEDVESCLLNKNLTSLTCDDIWLVLECIDGKKYVSSDKWVEYGNIFFEDYTILSAIGLKNVFQITDTYGMFESCTSLNSIDLSSWDTSSLTNASDMFFYCTSLSSIDLSSWDTSSLTDASSMFGYCTSLSSIDLSSWDTSSLTNASYMFSYCTSLSSIDLSSWDTSSLTNASYMFFYCTGLDSITGTLDFSGITSYTAYFTNYAFRNCTSLTSVYIKGLRTSLNLSYCPLTVECATYLLENLGDVYNSSYATITFDADMQDEYEADGEFEMYAFIAESTGWTITYA